MTGHCWGSSHKPLPDRVWVVAGAVSAEAGISSGCTSSVGNGVMVALQCPTADDVDRVYAKALALGAKDEGKAGPRGEDFYAGYFRDPDGNKLNVFCML